MALGMYFDSFGSLCDPVTGLFVYLGIGGELGQEELDIALSFMAGSPALKSLVRVSFLFLYS